MKPADVIGTGVWLASAVQVAGYTWAALAGEYSQFPSVGGGGANVNPSLGAQGDQNPGGVGNFSFIPEHKGNRIPIIGSGFGSYAWARRTLHNFFYVVAPPDTGGSVKRPGNAKRVGHPGR